MLAFFVRRTGSGDVAADLTAETFARALAGRERFDPSFGDAGAWLFGIARNLLATSLRRGRVDDSMRRRLGIERLVLDDEAVARIDALDGDPAVAALLELPADQRAAVAGRIVDEQSYPELASRLRCSESVARQRVSRGLRTLRTRLERTDEPAARSGTRSVRRRRETGRAGDGPSGEAASPPARAPVAAARHSAVGGARRPAGRRGSRRRRDGTVGPWRSGHRRTRLAACARARHQRIHARERARPQTQTGVRPGASGPTKPSRLQRARV